MGNSGEYRNNAHVDRGQILTRDIPMKILIAFATVFASSATLMAANSSAIEDVRNAAQKLAAAENYSWTTTRDSKQFAGPNHGRTGKGAYTCLDFPVQNNTFEAILRDNQGMIKTAKGWERLDAAANENVELSVRPWVAAWHFHLYTLPAVEAQIFAGQVENVVGSNGVYSGVIPTADPAKSGPKLSVKFWIKDGVLTKYQFNFKGTVQGKYGLTRDADVDQTTTVEIKDIGTTTITVPDEVRDKMS